MHARNLVKALIPALAMASSVSAAPTDRAWVEMAPDGGSLVRVLTKADVCPAVTVDGRREAMMERAVPAQTAPRPNEAKVAIGASFPALVCERALTRKTRSAALAGQSLPLPSARIDRIVLIGDTGCRLKASDNAWQACDRTDQWPFAAIAAKAAGLRPDMVLHVGDYLYRENPCPAGDQDCAGADWGYGEAGWRADFLDPAAPLLAVAPWVMVRGNHEECARAGQGWWRLLDPHPLLAGRDCNTAANDAAGDHTEPYPVELGGGARLIVADLIEMASGDPRDSVVVANVRADMTRIDVLTHGPRDSFVTAHYPLNAVLWNKTDALPDALTVGSKPVSGFASLPASHYRAMLAGHIHLFQYAGFSDRPTQVITGFSGTQEDPALGPASLAAIAGKAGGEDITALTTIPGRFGYALMERVRGGWRLTAYAVDGSVMGRFAL